MSRTQSLSDRRSSVKVLKPQGDHQHPQHQQNQHSQEASNTNSRNGNRNRNVNRNTHTTDRNGMSQRLQLLEQRFLEPPASSATTSTISTITTATATAASPNATNLSTLSQDITDPPIPTIPPSHPSSSSRLLVGHSHSHSHSASASQSASRMIGSKPSHHVSSPFSPLSQSQLGTTTMSTKSNGSVSSHQTLITAHTQHPHHPQPGHQQHPQDDEPTMTRTKRNVARTLHPTGTTRSSSSHSGTNTNTNTNTRVAVAAVVKPSPQVIVAESPPFALTQDRDRDRLMGGTMKGGMGGEREGGGGGSSTTSSSVRNVTAFTTSSHGMVRPTAARPILRSSTVSNPPPVAPATAASATAVATSSSRNSTSGGVVNTSKTNKMSTSSKKRKGTTPVKRLATFDTGKTTTSPTNSKRGRWKMESSSGGANTTSSSMGGNAGSIHTTRAAGASASSASVSTTFGGLTRRDMTGMTATTAMSTTTSSATTSATNGLSRTPSPMKAEPQAKSSTSTASGAYASSTSTVATTAITKPNALITNYFVLPGKPKASSSSAPLKQEVLQAGSSSSSSSTNGGGGGGGGSSTPNHTNASRVTTSSQEPRTDGPSPNDQLIHMSNTITQLQSQLSEKEAQLKAVSNNQTLIHHQLQTHLAQTQQKLQLVQGQFNTRIQTTSVVLQSLLVRETERAELELRQQLARDGARLGKFVGRATHSRFSLNPAVEHWEEGFAIQAIRHQRRNLKRRREALEGKLTGGCEAWWQGVKMQNAAVNKGAQVETSHANAGSTSGALLSQQEGVGVVVVDPMEREEFEASIRVHLEEMKKEENALIKEETSLRTETSKHQSALKRLANEDQSRFKRHSDQHPRLGPKEQYVLLSLLGKGGFSEVWRAYDLFELREVAIKIHQLDPRWSDAKSENYTKHVAREYDIHKEVRHPRIVSLYDVFEIDTNSFATVLEICNGTDLEALLKERKRLAESHARAILLQVLSGMKYLSSPSEDNSRRAIIHYDLKPGNILFDEHGDAKITDFGLSKIMDSQDPAESMELTSQGAGTYWYLPPECFDTTKSVRITNKVDVWSIGVIYYQMLFGERPYGHGLSQQRILNDGTILDAKAVQFPASPLVSEDCKNFIRRCLTYEQSMRPSIAELCQDAYVRGRK